MNDTNFLKIIDMKKVYIAGKIGGLLEHQYVPKFANAEHAFLLLKFQVVNPVTLPHNHERTWKAYMKEDLHELKKCSHIFMLNNWEDSRGGRLEHWYAKRYNIIVIYQPKNDNNG
jgi:hypothetical protein